MLRLTLYLLFVVTAFAQNFVMPRVNIAQDQDYLTKAGTTGINGDTFYYTAWAKAGTGGNWNTGKLYGQWNDGGWVSNTPNSALALIELVSYDSTNVNNTSIGLINAMASYGVKASGGCGGNAAWSTKSFAPFAKTISGTDYIYWPINCQLNTGPYTGGGSTMIVSPDYGAHWCRQLDVSSSSANCNSGIWFDGTTGPGPIAVGDIIWGSSVTDSANKFFQWAVLQVCQDFATNCPSVPGGCDPVADNAVCVYGRTGNYSSVYMLRIVGDPMNLSNYSYWNGTSWGATAAGATAVASFTSASTLATDLGSPGCAGSSPGLSAMYTSHYGVMLMAEVCNNASNVIRTHLYQADVPIGPYRRLFTSSCASMSSCLDNTNSWFGHLPQLVLPTFHSVSSGHYRVMVATGADATGSNYWPHFQEWDLWDSAPRANDPVKVNASRTYTVPTSWTMESGTIQGRGLTDFYDALEGGGSNPWQLGGLELSAPYAKSCSSVTGTPTSLVVTQTGWKFTAGTSCRMSSGKPTQYAGDKDWSMTFAWTSTSLTSRLDQTIYGACTTSATCIAVRANHTSGDGKIRIAWNNGSGEFGYETTSGVLTANSASIITITKVAGSPTTTNTHIYANGVDQPLTSFGVLAAPNTATSANSQVGTDTLGDDASASGILHTALFWSRALTGPEAIGTRTGPNAMGVYPVLKYRLGRPPRSLTVL